MASVATADRVATRFAGVAHCRFQLQLFTLNSLNKIFTSKPTESRRNKHTHTHAHIHIWSGKPPCVVAVEKVRQSITASHNLPPIWLCAQIGLTQAGSERLYPPKRTKNAGQDSRRRRGKSRGNRGSRVRLALTINFARPLFFFGRHSGRGKSQRKTRNECTLRIAWLSIVYQHCQ